MTDAYSVAPGWNDPNLPPVNLPSLDLPPQPLRITVGARRPPQPAAEAPVAAKAPWEGLPKVEAPKKAEPVTTVAPSGTTPAAPWDSLPKVSEQPPKQAPVIGTGEAAGIGLAQGMSFGAAPAIMGLSEAAGPAGQGLVEREQAAIGQDPRAGEVAGGATLLKPFIGAFRMIRNALSENPDPSVSEAYERGRQEALERRDAAFDQHQAAYMLGMVGGSLLTPSFGVGAPAAAGARIVQGIKAGGIGGGLYGVGEGISEGKTPTQIAQKLPSQVATGAALGGTITGAIGPRLPGAGPGAQAARTAEALGQVTGSGSALPKGVASERPVVQGTTSKVMSLPLVGERIREGVQATERAAGEAIEATAGHLAGPAAGSRATAAEQVRPGVQAAIDANMARIDAAYGTRTNPVATSLRGRIDPDREMPMPHTAATVQNIINRRTAARQPNPQAGLEQAMNLATHPQGTSFNGAHRARSDIRSANPAVHPGYDAADFNAIARAITEDMRANVAAAARNQTPRGRSNAVQAFDRAEREFGPLAEMNQVLQHVRDAGENGVARVLSAAREKGGDLQLLQHLRQTMPQNEFNMFSGVLLNELGMRAGTGEFSLAQFATNFNKLSERAVNTMFSPQHATALRAIAGMGDHIKKALETASKSHSSNWLAMMDIAKDMVLLAHEFGRTSAVGSGAETWAAVLTTPALYGMAWMLGNPARAQSFANFSRAYQALTLNQPTPARIAAFNITTRNLAHQLGVPVERMMQTVADRVRAEPTEPDKDQQRAPVGR